jgi:hypothetical protein
MEFKQLKKALDAITSLSDKERALILECAQIDTIGKVKKSKVNEEAIIKTFNEVFSKNSRVISKKVVNKYREIFTHYTLDEVKEAMEHARDDDFHIETRYKYCTIEYFSRMDQLDKWLNAKPGGTSPHNDFKLPKFNVKRHDS